ncbi:MAG: DUF2079 domain-containing protein, partial [Vulcanimicrobiaceae bacterium]
LLRDPAHLAALADVGRLSYLLEALAPLAFLPLCSRWSLLAVPGLAGLLLSSDPIAWRMGSHYPALWIPWLLLGACAVLVRRARHGDPWYRTALAACVLFLVAFDPLHPLHYLRPIYPHEDAARALALVPPGAHLVTHDEWFVHAALADPNAGIFFCPYVDFAVFADDYPNGYFQSEIRPEIARELTDGRMSLVASFDAVRVYRRTPEPDARVGDCITPGNVRYRSLRATLATRGRRP